MRFGIEEEKKIFEKAKYWERFEIYAKSQRKNSRNNKNYKKSW